MNKSSKTQNKNQEQHKNFRACHSKRAGFDLSSIDLLLYMLHKSTDNLYHCGKHDISYPQLQQIS